MSQSSNRSSGGSRTGAAAGGRTTSLRFAGVEIVDLNAAIWVGLSRYVFGIGSSLAHRICKDVGVNPDKKCRFLTDEEETLIRSELAKYKLEGDLRRQIASHKMRLQKIRAYRGLRHFQGLPCRGQNTRNNAKTAGRVK